MRVEVTEDVLRDNYEDKTAETSRHYDHVKGDTLTVPDELGQKWCRLGWAKDLDGIVPTGERKPGPEIILEVQDHTLGVKAPQPGA